MRPRALLLSTIRHQFRRRATKQPEDQVASE